MFARVRHALTFLLPNLLGLGGSLVFALRWWPPPTPLYALVALTTALGGLLTVLADPFVKRRLQRRGPWVLPGCLGTFGLLSLWAVLLWIPRLVSWHLAAWVAFGALTGCLIRLAWVRACRRRCALGAEAVRWLVVVGATGWLIHPYASRCFVGGGDAHHYAQQMADASEQLREGVFPILVGQSIHAFNGDIHPLRTAPYFQHVGALINALCGFTLDGAATQNLLITLSALMAAMIGYLALGEIGGRKHAWTACALAVGMMASPGILALIYSGDMVASWMALPWLPWTFWGVVRWSRHEGRAGAILQVASGLGALWLAHAPIAFWATLIAAGTVLLTSTARRSLRRDGWLLLGGAAVAGCLSVYVFASVASLELPDDPNMRRFVTSGGTLTVLREGWTGFLQPTEATGSYLLRNLQLSPILWMCVFLGLLAKGRTARVTAGVLMVAVVGFMALLVPLTWLAQPLWSAMPQAVLGITDKWPMQRFYPILSVIVPVIAMIGLGSRPAWAGAKGRQALTLIIFIGVAWSIIDAWPFLRRGRAIAQSEAFTQQRLRPENVLLSRYSYEMFGRVPRTFTHGTTSPWTQTSLLDSRTLEPAMTNSRSVLDAQAVWKGTTRHRFVATDYGGRFEPALRLEPGHAYLVNLPISGATLDGTFQLIGRTLFREYPIGPNGESQGFGVGPTQQHSFSVWTSDKTADEVELRFYRNPSGPKLPKLGPVQLIDFDRARLPIRVTGLIPFEVTVDSPGETWLETPKLFVAGYQALVDGVPQEVERSPDGLAMVRITPGPHQIAVRYVGPWWLKGAAWLTTLAWIVLCCGALLLANRREFIPLCERGLGWAGRLATGGVIVVALGACVRQVINERPAVSRISQSERFRLRVLLPVSREGNRETIAKLPREGRVWSLVAHYLNGQSIELELAADGRTVAASGAVPVNYLVSHQLMVSWPTAHANALPRILLDQRLIFGDPVESADRPAAAAGSFTGRIVEAKSLPLATK